MGICLFVCTMSWLTLVHVLIQLTAIAIALRLLSALLLGEPLSAWNVVGAVMIIGSAMVSEMQAAVE